MSFGSGFGGGDISQRAQIMLSLRSEGATEAQAIRQEIEKLTAQAKQLDQIYRDGQITLRDKLTTEKEYVREITGLTRILNDLTSTERSSVSAANEMLRTMVLTTEQVQEDIVARRQQQNAIAGVARERQHLNDVIAQGAQMEQQATRFVTQEQIGAHVKLQQVISQTTKLVERGVEAQNTGTPKANQFGYAILHVSHAFQDLQYGIAATLNNIPLIVTSFGGGPGLAGTMMAAAVAIQLVSENVGDLGAALGISRNMATGFANTVEEAKAKVSALTSKTFKFSLDYSALHAAEAQLERMKKLKDLVEGTKESTPEKEYAAGIQKLVQDKGGGSKALERAVAAENRGFKIGDAMDLAKVENMSRLISQLNKRQEQDPSNIRALAIWDLTRQRDAAQERIDQARKEFIQQEVGGFLSGDPRAVAAMKARALKAPTQFDPEFRAELAKLPSSSADWTTKEEAKKAKAEAAQKKREDETARRDRERADAHDARMTAQEKAAAARERSAQIAHQASAFGTQFSQEGELSGAILGRLQAGSNPTIGLATQVRERIGDSVPADIAQEVADRIVNEAKTKVEAEVAAAGGGKAGMAALAAQRMDKMNRAARAADNRQARDALDGQEQMIAGMIAQEAGGALGENGVAAAARRAMNEIRQGSNEQMAVMSAIAQTLQELAHEQARVRQAMMGMMNGVGAVRAQAGRQRARRPPLMPVFPQ